MAGFFRTKYPKVPGPITDETTINPYEELYGYVRPPGENASFLDQYSYLNKISPETFMQLGAGLMSGDAPSGIINASQEMQQARNEQQKLGAQSRKDNMTAQWLQSKFPDLSPADIEAAMSNPAIMSEITDDNNDWINLGDGNIYSPSRDEFKSVPAPGGEATGDLPFPKGKTAEELSLNGLVTAGRMSKEDAWEVAAGRPVTLPDGSVIFMGASDLTGHRTIKVKRADGTEQTVDENGDLTEPAPTTTAEQPAAPAVAPQAPTVAEPGGVGEGGTIVAPPRVDPATVKVQQEMIRRQRSLNEQLDNYTTLIEKYGIEGGPPQAEGKAALELAQTGIEAEIRKLFELGVLNEADQPKIDAMLFDATVNLQEGLWKSLGQGLTGAFGTAVAKQKALAQQLKDYIDIQVRATTGEAKPGAPVRISTQAEFDALEPGTNYINTRTGEPGTKPGPKKGQP